MADLSSTEQHLYNFKINADSSQAMQDLQELQDQIAKVQKQIDDLNKSKINLQQVVVNDPKTGEPLKYKDGKNKGKEVKTYRRSTTDPEIDNKMANLAYDLNKSMGASAKLSATLRRDKNNAILSGDRKGAQKAEIQMNHVATSAKEMVDVVMNETRKLHGMSDRDGNPLGNHKFLPNANQMGSGVSDAQTNLALVQELHKEIKNTYIGTKSIADRAIGTGQINAGQANLYASNVRKIADPEGEFQTTRKASALEWQATARTGIAETVQMIKEIEGYIEKAEARLAKKGISPQNKERIEDELDTYRASLASVKEDKTAHETALKTAQAAYSDIETNAEKIKNVDLKVQEADITKLEDRNTPRGRATERAFAIASMTQMAMAFRVRQSMQNGASTWDGMQDSSISIGNRMGSYDYRGLRKDAQRSGLDYGYDGKTMLGFQDSILGSLGNKNPSEIMALSSSLAAFTKTSGVSQETSTGLMQSMYRSGAVGGASDSKYIQDAIIGGIKASGMQGREEEQIKALNGILDAQYSGRSATKEEINSTLAMASLFSKEGGAAFQGNNLQTFMASMSEAVRGSSMYSAQGLLLGSTSDPRYQGIDGAYNFAVQREKGFDAENANEIIQNALDYANGSSKGAAYVINQTYGSGVGTEDLAKLIEKMQKEGLSLDAETLKKYQDANAASGAEKTEEATDAYQDSSDYAKDLKELTREMVDLNTADNKITEELNRTLGELNKYLSQSTGGSMLSSIGGGLISGLAQGVMSSVLSSYGTGFIRKLTTSKWFGAGTVAKEATEGIPEVITKMSKMDKAKGLFGKAKNGFSNLFKSSGDDVAESVVKSSGDDMFKSMLRYAGDDVVGALGKAGKFLGAGAKGLGKVMPLLGAGMSVLNIANAEDKGNQIAKEGLGWGGATAGALAGTAILPGIGTVIGAGVGAIGGSLLGESGVGDWLGEKINGIGSWFKDVFNGGDSTSESDEKSTSTAKTLAEKRREANNSSEAINLAKQETLIGRIQTLLDQAKAQNGIIGVANGATGGSSSRSGSSVSGMSYTGSGEYWTNTDIKQHDLAVTSNTLTADQLNEWINSNAGEGSTMRGMGQAFLDAGAQSGLDPRYLVSHAALETGWGSSEYSRAGNFYGIGAFDSNPDNALKYGNGSSSTGIIEGAKWIAENYYSQGQTTLDSMRNNGGTHEYATDPNWDEKIASIMKGSESYTTPSTINTTVNLEYKGTGNTTNDAANLANQISTQIPTAYLQNQTRQA